MRPLSAVAFALCAAVLWHTPVMAAPINAPLRAEIDALLSTLQSSSCQFRRNDAWHDALTAKTHLLRKLDYLEGKNAVHSTEQFIELAASNSSVSGQPYWVRCGSAVPVASKNWLSAQLQVVRASSRAAALSAR